MAIVIPKAVATPASLETINVLILPSPDEECTSEDAVESPYMGTIRSKGITRLLLLGALDIIQVEKILVQVNESCLKYPWSGPNSFIESTSARYGYIKNHKKTVKNGQARTRESKEYKAEARKVKPQSKSAKKNQKIEGLERKARGLESSLAGYK
ncbi:hypothetical protein Tco_1326735 [Tanacetum coccineum]